jgi:hypothetical protein
VDASPKHSNKPDRPGIGREAAASPLKFLLRLVLGRPLANRESGEQRIGTLEGVPAMGLDGVCRGRNFPPALMFMH